MGANNNIKFSALLELNWNLALLVAPPHTVCLCICLVKKEWSRADATTTTQKEWARE
eukprot:m.5112 g.5112  ORF g.5112 m.5112 type:complete len:57 (-) comp2223_c0_seq1:296-466(-)